MKKTIKQILFLFCILLNVTFIMLLVDVTKGIITGKDLSFASGLPCTYNVITTIIIFLSCTLVATYALYKDDSFK